MNGPQVSLIISTYNRPAALDRVLAGVAAQTVVPAEVLVADDGSGDDTRHRIAAWRRRLPCPLRHVWHEDDGFRKTTILNQAVVEAEASSDYLVLLDGDCVPHRRFIEDHRRLAEPGYWVQGRRCFIKEPWVSRFVPGKSSVLFWALTGRLTGVAKAFRLPWPVVQRNQGQRGIIGCNQAVWRGDLEAINGFDEEYAGWGIGEDSDMGARLYHLGRPRKFVHGHAVVFHLNHPAPSKDHVPRSQARLQETIRSGKVRCEVGLDRHRRQLPPARP